MADPEPIANTIDAKSEELKKVSKMHCDKCGKDTHTTESHGKKGGARANSGMQPGTKIGRTLEQKAVRDNFNQMVMRAATKLFNAQFNLAIGEQSLFLKKTIGEGKNRRTEIDVVTDVETIKEYLVDDGLYLNNQSDEEYYYLATKPANNMAIDSLLNRGIGKAPDRIEIDGGFFIQNKLIVEVVGPRHADVTIGADGRIEGADEAEGQQSSEPSNPTPEAPPSS